MRKFLKILCVIAFFIIVMICYPKIDVTLGISAERYEKDARAVMEIPDDWEMVKNVSSDCVAMLFYSEDRTQSKFSIYEASYGSFLFGKTSCLRGVRGLDEHETYEHWAPKDIVYLSMNDAQIEELCFEFNGTDYIIKVPSKHPFVIFAPHEYQLVGACTRGFYFDVNSSNIGDIRIASSDLTGDGQEEFILVEGSMSSTNPLGIGELRIFEKMEDVYQSMRLPFKQDGETHRQMLTVTYNKAEGQTIKISVDGTAFQQIINIPDDLWNDAAYSSLYVNGHQESHTVWNCKVQNNNGIDKLVCSIQLFDKWSPWGLDIVLKYQDNQFVIDNILFCEDIYKAWM